MALSFGLGNAGHTPERLAVSATVTFDQVDGGWKVVSSALTVRGTVPGLDDAGFKEAAAGFMKKAFGVTLDTGNLLMRLDDRLGCDPLVQGSGVD